MNLDIWGFLLVLLISALIGLVAQAIVGFSRGGLLVAIAIGFVGALIGIWVYRATGAPELITLDIGSMRFPIVWSIIGAVVFVCFVNLFTRPRWVRV